jgi:hypothetical protein
VAVRHRLHPDHRHDDPAMITRSLVALHSTDPATVYLSAVARMRSPDLDAVSAALYEQRSLVRHHGMRRTVWVTEPRMTRAVQASTTASIARTEWRNLEAAAARSGIDDPARWVASLAAEVLAALHAHGPSNARQLGKAVPALTRKIVIGSGKYTQEAAAHTRVLQNLGFDGTIVRTTPAGGWTSSEYTWVASDDWIDGGINGDDADAGAAMVLGAYVRSFGPVTVDDMRWWTGWTASLVQRTLATIGAVEVTLEDGRTAWVAADDVDPVADPGPWVALLPALDPTAMGWKERSWYLGPYTTFPCELFDRNGNVGPTVWLDGRVVGAWTQRADGTVVTGLLEPLAAKDIRRVDRAAASLAELLEGSRVTPRFPTPLQVSLMA